MIREVEFTGDGHDFVPDRVPPSRRGNGALL